MQHIQRLRWRVPCLVALAALALSGCKEETTSPPTTEVTFTSIQTNIFAKNCVTSSCHGTLGQRGGLVLEGSGAYDNLVGAAPTNEAALARGLVRVSPGKPESSFLMVKLTGPGTGEGDLMPQGSSGLQQSAIETIRTWIANGAKRD